MRTLLISKITFKTTLKITSKKNCFQIDKLNRKTFLFFGFNFKERKNTKKNLKNHKLPTEHEMINKEDKIDSWDFDLFSAWKLMATHAFLP